jgi:hypothetical protein
MVESTEAPMPAKKGTTSVAVGITTRPDETGVTNAYPEILKGKKIPPFVLPAEFDSSGHQRLHRSGEAKAATLSDRMDLIETFTRKKPAGFTSS